MASPAPKSTNSVALGRETPRSVRKMVSHGMCALKFFMAKHVKSKRGDALFHEARVGSP